MHVRNGACDYGLLLMTLRHELESESRGVFVRD
jgi:hypothetical protein